MKLSKIFSFLQISGTVLVVIIIVSLILKSGTYEVKFFIDDINQNVDGVIQQVVFRKINRYEILCKDGKVQELCVTTDTFDSFVSIGDSIIKKKNSNFAFVKKKNGWYRLVCCSIPSEVRIDQEWPKEWEGKWLDQEKIEKLDSVCH